MHILFINFNLTNFFSALNPVIYGFMSKSFRTSFRKTVCNCQLYAKNEEPMATQWEHEGKGEEVEIQPQICCNHRNTAVLTNNHGLRINHSRGALNRYVVRMNMTHLTFRVNIPLTFPVPPTYVPTSSYQRIL